MIDAAGRTIDYMRISITDRCNLRCRYCMPDGITQVAMSEILTYEEIKKICTLAEELGIRKIKITGICSGDLVVLFMIQCIQADIYPIQSGIL